MDLFTTEQEIAASWDHFALDDAYALPPAMSAEQLRCAVGQHATQDEPTLRQQRGLSRWENEGGAGEGGAGPDRWWAAALLHGSDVGPSLLTSADTTT